MWGGKQKKSVYLQSFERDYKSLIERSNNFDTDQLLPYYSATFPRFRIFIDYFILL